MAFRVLGPICAIALACAACAALPDTRQHQFAGEVTLYSDGHVLGGQMELADGSCLTLSLPDRFLDRMERGESYHMDLLGRLYTYRPDPGAQIFVDGREMPYPTCGRILYVE